MNTENVKKIKLLETSIKILRIVFLFPSDKELNDPKANVYYKHLILLLISIYFLIGATLHFILNLKKGIYYKIDSNIGFVLSYAGTSYYLFRYILKLKDFIVVCKQLSDFRSFGKPNNFDKRNAFLNKVSMVYIIYHVNAMTILSLSSLFYIKRCKQENLTNNYNEVCGLITPIWFPFDFDYFPVKQIVFVYQFFSVGIVFNSAGFLSFFMFATLEHLSMRFKHVEDIFVEALNEKNETTQRFKFRKAIQYHQAVINLGQLLNECFNPGMMVHISLTGPFIGIAGYIFITSIPLDYSALLLGWTLSTSMVCIGGQRLMEASNSVGRLMLRIDWYNLKVDLQRDLTIIVLRSRKPIYLTAGPFGPITYSTLVTIIKTSYSFVTLLNQTM